MKTTENKLLGYSEYCHEFIKDHIEGYEDQQVYACDLGMTITEGINIDGTATYSTYEAKRYLKEWWDEASDYFEYEKLNFGQNLHNPFERPEAFHVCMIIEGVRSLLSQSKYIDKHWNEEITLTEKVIKKILKQIEGKEVEL